MHKWSATILGISLLLAGQAGAQTKEQMEKFARESPLIGTLAIVFSSAGVSPTGGKITDRPTMAPYLGVSHKDYGLGVAVASIIPLENGDYEDRIFADVDKREALLNNMSINWDIPGLPELIDLRLSYSQTYFPQGMIVQIDTVESYGFRTKVNTLLNPTLSLRYPLNAPYRGHVGGSLSLSESIFKSGFHNISLKGSYAHRTYRFAKDVPSLDYNNAYSIVEEDGTNKSITPRLKPGRTALTWGAEYRLGPIFTSINRTISKDNGNYNCGYMGVGTIF